MGEELRRLHLNGALFGDEKCSQDPLEIWGRNLLYDKLPLSWRRQVIDNTHLTLRNPSVAVLAVGRDVVTGGEKETDKPEVYFIPPLFNLSTQIVQLTSEGSSLQDRCSWCSRWSLHRPESILPLWGFPIRSGTNLTSTVISNFQLWYQILRKQMLKPREHCLPWSHIPQE